MAAGMEGLAVSGAGAGGALASGSATEVVCFCAGGRGGAEETKDGSGPVLR